MWLSRRSRVVVKVVTELRVLTEVTGGYTEHLWGVVEVTAVACVAWMKARAEMKVLLDNN